MFMALSEDQQEQATHLLMAFGITQLNTSPIDGMKYMWRVVESMEAGKGLPADIVELQKMAGLNGEALKHLMETGYLSEEGMGQKLIDFVDSLLGMDGRTVPVRGPNGTWTAVAGDIWAKRDVGLHRRQDASTTSGMPTASSTTSGRSRHRRVAGRRRAGSHRSM